MINHHFLGPLGVLTLRHDTRCQAIVPQQPGATHGPVCGQPLCEHVFKDTPGPSEKSLTEEELRGFWRRACVIADQQISYPAANILTEFVSLIQDNGRSTP